MLRRLAITSATALALLAGCASSTKDEHTTAPFTLAMLPDTQNYVDYTHQTAEGFALDASTQFIEQMRWIASQSPANGGDIVFVASVGDVWQHQTLDSNESHTARGVGHIENPYFASRLGATPKTRAIEIPESIAGYKVLADAGLPFGVAPGNHDYDAMWSAEGYPPNLRKAREDLTFTAEDLGIIHIGGLDNFRSAFGDDTSFFVDKPWYVDSFRGGANSAQVFEGGGYTFLHVAIEMGADDAVVAWVESVLEGHAGLPTILTTHDYLDPRGERRANPIVDLERVDPDHHNSAEELFEKLIRPNDQIFMVLCGHHHGQALRIDQNDAGHAVYQILADYQDRGQSGLDAGQPRDPLLRQPVGIGDGWLRLLRFDLTSASPSVQVRTYSTHYDTLSGDLDSYAAWYRKHEQPEMSDTEFLDADAYTLSLVDFLERFGPRKNSP